MYEQLGHEPIDGPQSDELVEDFRDDAALYSETNRAPSLPVILFSTACGISLGVITLYVAVMELGLSPPLVAGVATFAVLFGLGGSGALFSALIGSRAAPINILYSCGLSVLAVLVLGICMICGALFGALLLAQ